MCIRDSKDILSTDSDAGLKDEYSEALEIKRICHEHKVPLIINDNVQFAIDIYLSPLILLFSKYKTHDLHTNCLSYSDIHISS